MRYFDIRMLDDYLKLGLKFQVYVDGRYLTVTKPDDLITSKKGIGVDNNGESVPFEYTNVDHIMIGSIALDKSELEKIDKFGNPLPEPEPEGEEGSEEEAPPEEEEEEEI